MEISRLMQIADVMEENGEQDFSNIVFCYILFFVLNNAEQNKKFKVVWLNATGEPHSSSPFMCSESFYNDFVSLEFRSEKYLSSFSRVSIPVRLLKSHYACALLQKALQTEEGFGWSGWYYRPFTSYTPLFIAPERKLTESNKFENWCLLFKEIDIEKLKRAIESVSSSSNTRPEYDWGCLDEVHVMAQLNANIAIAR